MRHFQVRESKIVPKIPWLTLSLILLLSLNITRPTSSLTALNKSSISRSLGVNLHKYHNYTEIMDTLQALNDTYPAIVDVFSIGKSWQDQNIFCTRLTNESSERSKPKILLVGYSHARERITAELLLHFVTYSVENYGINKTIAQVLDQTEIYVVVALNVDGFSTVEVNEWQRKNARPIDEDGDGISDEDPADDEDRDGFIEDLVEFNNSDSNFLRWEGVDDDADGRFNEDWIGGVDLNRNYGYQWNATVDSGSQDPSAEDYKGPAPFSEPETQALRDLALQHKFKYALSFHSGTEFISYPWGYTNEPPPDKERFIQISKEFSNLVDFHFFQSGSSYTLSGAFGDWIYWNRSTLAFTCEIYGNPDAWQYETTPVQNVSWEKGVFQFFNPEPHEIEHTIQKWMPVFFCVANRAIREETTRFLDLSQLLWIIVVVTSVTVLFFAAFFLRRHQRRRREDNDIHTKITLECDKCGLATVLFS
ncbi:MAG: M14 family zinc carboxypeptidase [Candidatus Bathyarchaeota archaeon]|nr:M14 family zinc carboxypeptidase [Candidatus Bathyarchaeota archaeon]